MGDSAAAELTCRFPSKFTPEWLKGIKQLEHNGSLLGQLVMWEDVLVNRNDDIFVEPYPFLAFGKLVSFELERGLEDSAWTANDEKAAESTPDLPAGLFDAS